MIWGRRFDLADSPIEDTTMNFKPDAPEAVPSNQVETPPTSGAQIDSDRTRGSKPFTGAYYWFPTPAPEGVNWSIVTCRDLGCDSDAGHDADLWPRLMTPLAATWGKDAKILKHRLALSYTGLPRGRVTRPDKTFLVLHGKDSPVQGYEEMVVMSFRLTGRKVKFIYDEHETQLPGHSRTWEAMLGSRPIKSKG